MHQDMAYDGDRPRDRLPAIRIIRHRGQLPRVKCRKCGEPTGAPAARYCRDCTSELSRQLKDPAREVRVLAHQARVQAELAALGEGEADDA